ncbi:MAG: hypothetical protein Q8S00_04820 [Deltaproteobacteria bacterium]|nr:hypothetical protein [Deltaproteobacteria bacterium]
MFLDHRERCSAVVGQPLDVDPVGQAHRNKRVARAIGLSRPDLQAPKDSIPNPGAPGVEVKRLAFLIQKDVALLGCLQRLDLFENIDRGRQEPYFPVAAGRLGSSVLIQIAALADGEKTIFQINVAPAKPQQL